MTNDFVDCPNCGATGIMACIRLTNIEPYEYECQSCREQMTIREIYIWNKPN